MRIAVLSTLASGGAAGAAWRITRALSDYGHDCSYFILEGSGNPLQIPLLDNDDTFWLPALFRHWSALTTSEALAANATELFSDTVLGLNVSLPLPEVIREAEVIHLHWIAGMLFSPALLRAMTGKKVVCTLHDENAFTGGCHYAGSCRSFQEQCSNCPLLKKSGADDASARCFNLKEQIYHILNPSIVTPSVWLAEKVKSSALLGNYPVASIIPNPLDIEIFQPPRSRSDLRRKLGLPEDAFVILAGCEHLSNPRKNTKTLFEALNLLAGQSPELPVTVLTYGHGQAPELAFPIHHLGYVDNEAVMAELYGAADLFVHTSLLDNLPLTLCEAQACGTPTLCFAVGGCPETMLPDKTGFIVAETTNQALAEKIRSIIAERDSLSGMRETARAFAVECFNPVTVAVAYTEVFEKAKIAQGLKTTDALFAELLQNQIVSLALFLQESSKEINSGINSRISGIDNRISGINNRINGINDRISGINDRISGIEMRLEKQAQRFEALRWNLRHPFRWFLSKLRSKCRRRSKRGPKSAV